MVAPASIADDWQDVSDDAFSIVSLPTSDEHSECSDDTTKYPETGRDGTKSNKSSFPIRAKSSLPTESNPFDDEHAVENEVEQYGGNIKDIVASDDSSSNPRMSDMLDVVDPVFLHKVTTSLIKLVDEIKSALTFRTNRRPMAGTSEIVEDCDTLRKNLKCLEPIMEGYSKHWSPQKATVDIPLDPGLYEWMSGLKVKLLGLQALILKQMSEIPASFKHPTVQSEINQYHATMLDFSGQISAFLPVLQADYDDFHAASIPFASTSSSSNAIHRLAGRTPTSDLFHLRRELYSLKDQIAVCVNELKGCASGFVILPRDDAISRDKLIRSYEQIKKSLGLLLSNHGSDWLEYSMAGGMTYPEFCQLNLDTIRSLNLQLKQLVDNLSTEHRRLRGTRYLNDPDSLLDSHETLQFNRADLDGLRAVQEVLFSLLQIQAPQPTAPDKLNAGNLRRMKSNDEHKDAAQCGLVEKGTVEFSH